MNKVNLEAYWQGFKRSLVTYTRLPLKVDWSEDVAHVNPIAFLPWVGIVVAIISAWHYGLSCLPLFKPYSCY